MAEETWVRLRLLRNVLFGLAGVIFGLGLIFLARTLFRDGLDVFEQQQFDTLQFSYQYLLNPAIPASILLVGGLLVHALSLLYDDWAELNGGYADAEPQAGGTAPAENPSSGSEQPGNRV